MVSRSIPWSIGALIVLHRNMSHSVAAEYHLAWLSNGPTRVRDSRCAKIGHRLNALFVADDPEWIHRDSRIGIAS